MKKLLALILIANVAYATERQLPGGPLTKALNGSAFYLGTIVATTVKDNLTTATPFLIPDGTNVMVQCDAAANIVNLAAGATNSVAAKMPKVAADEKYVVGMLRRGTPLVSIICVSGTCNCPVYRIN